MSYAEEKFYQTKRIVQQHRLDRRFERDFEIETQFAVFTLGSQIKVDSTTKKENIVVFKKPASAFDWIKCLIVEFDSTLKFGWLIPKMITVKLERDIHYNDTYYNVLPTPKQFCDREVMAYQRFTGERFPLFSEIDLLEAEPPTRKEVEKKRIEAHEIAAYLGAFDNRY